MFKRENINKLQTEKKGKKFVFHAHFCEKNLHCFFSANNMQRRHKKSDKYSIKVQNLLRNLILKIIFIFMTKSFIHIYILYNEIYEKTFF